MAMLAPVAARAVPADRINGADADAASTVLREIVMSPPNLSLLLCCGNIAQENARRHRAIEPPLNRSQAMPGPAQSKEIIMAALAPIVLLFCSNIFMTFAWYGQLKFPNVVLWQVILVSWGIAFFEYCLAVPANRIGHQVYSAAQLKTLQEIITLLVFGVFSVMYLGESLKWNHMVAFMFLCGAAFFSFHKWT
jgi:uncharacterized protein (DUF486 family)